MNTERNYDDLLKDKHLAMKIDRESSPLVVAQW